MTTNSPDITTAFAKAQVVFSGFGAVLNNAGPSRTRVRRGSGPEMLDVSHFRIQYDSRVLTKLCKSSVIDRTLNAKLNQSFPSKLGWVLLI